MTNRLRLMPLVMLVCVLEAQAGTLTHEVVVGDPSVYGNGENAFPFGTLPDYYGHASTRYQQVYASSAFPGALTITELVFYASSHGEAPILPGTIEIYLSVTGRGVNEISQQAFDDNLGGDPRLFATLVGGFSLTGSELAIDGKPFYYDPAQGNLLLDIRFNGIPLGHAGPFFASLGPGNFTGGATSPFSRWHDFGVGFDNQGLVTGFREYVPEPGTLLLLGLGLLGFGVVRRSRQPA